MSGIHHKNFGVKASLHDLLKITQDSILKSVLTEIHATYKLNHYSCNLQIHATYKFTQDTPI